MLDPNDRSHLMEPASLAAAVDFSEIDGLLGDRARLIEHPQLGRTLEALCHTVLTRMSRGLLLCVRATRTSLLRAVRTEGTGQLAPGPNALYARPYAYQLPGVPCVPRTVWCTPRRSSEAAG